MKNFCKIALLFILFAGCSTVKQGWNDFTAYYNTFYNAKQFYNSGLAYNKRQVPQINPIQPIRIHVPPSSAGLDDFEQAIEKGSSILRNHEESKFVLPAIALIGKSFYYRSEFFSALEKFQELETLSDGELAQEAVLWQGRTYLEMANYNEGIRLLEVKRDLIEGWNPEIRAEVDAVLAQLNTAIRNWDMAAEYLKTAIPNLENTDLKARAYFLLGQVNEQLGDDSQALFAYNQISGLRTTYDLEFNAIRKEAEVSRRIGNFQRADYLYRGMQRDDKFLEYSNVLQYEIARTYQLRDMPEPAIENYQMVLDDRRQTPTAITRAKTYYGLAEVYRDQLNSFSLAAAYFDSAASIRVDETQLPDGFNARELADSFGQYANIKQQITHKDSLLRVAQLSPEDLDELVSELQRAEAENVEEELSRIQRDRGRRMIVADEPDSVLEAAVATEHGFLNINNRAMLQDASLQFQAIWGDRPLADNWRRRADVSGSRFDQIVLRDEEDTEIELEPESAGTGVLPAVDLSDIPFTAEEQEIMNTEIEDLNYRLANVFFLSLDMPDSAKTYYQKVVESSFNEHLVTMSLYSIAEIDLLSNREDEAYIAFEKLLEINPNSVYTRRIADRLDVEINLIEEAAIPKIEQQYYEITNQDEETPSADRAENLVSLAARGDTDSQRARLLFEAAREYMKVARLESGNQQLIREWFDKQQEQNVQKAEFESLQDSARVMIADTTLSEQEAEYWQKIADSTLAEPDFSEHFPFEGAYWDTTRSILKRIETYYASSNVMPSVTILQQTLKKQEPEVPEDRQPEAEIPDDIVVQTNETAASSCEEMGISIDMEGGMDEFMKTITFPSWTESISMRGEVVYKFSIQPDGTIQSYEQISQMDRSGIPQSIENAIDQILRFSPSGSRRPVQCIVVFPIYL